MASDNKRAKFARVGMAALGHLTGIMILFAIYCLAFLSEAAAQALMVGLNDDQMAGQIVLEGVLIFGVISTLWAFGYIMYRLAREHRKARKKRVLKLAKGTVLTETLIVLPVFLMLTFGLCQMGINSMAGLLTTLGTYEAARTVAVWGPEIGHDRAGTGTVSQTDAETRARAAGAGVVAPVVSVTVASQGNCGEVNSSHPVQLALDGMGGVGVLPSGVGEAQVWSLAEAFGSRPFAARAAPKYKLAFCASHVDVDWGSVIKDPTDNGRNEVEVTYTYVHRNVFPFVRHIFSNGANGKSHPYTAADVTAISRTYRLHQQISPNPEQPHMNVIESAIQGIGSWRDG